jgi:nucleoside-diphosphate-sugar epimerase
MSNDLYLITGATGATGGNAIQELLSQGARVRPLFTATTSGPRHCVPRAFRLSSASCLTAMQYATHY